MDSGRLAPDVAPLTLAAQPVARAAAEIYARHTGHWLIGLLAHGSALKGGYIPGCSDLDLHLYLTNDAFDADGRLPLDLSFAIQRELSGIPLSPFQYIQCAVRSVRSAAPREGWVGPVPGAYHMILGHLPIPEATAVELRVSAQQALTNLRPVPDYIANGLFEYGRERLERHARYLCTEIWPLVYHVLTLENTDPIAVWRLPKTEAIPLLPESHNVRETAQAFLAVVRAAFGNPFEAERYISVLLAGVTFRQAVAQWRQDSLARNAAT